MARRSTPSTPRRARANVKGRKRKRFTDEELARIDYRDPEYLKTFLTEKGKIRARTTTGLSRRDQTRLAREVKRSREIALLPYVARAEPGAPRRGRRDRDEER